MKIFFVMWHPPYVLRLYESALRGLLSAGHRVHLGFTSIPLESLQKEAGEFLGDLESEFPALTYGVLPNRAGLWRSFLTQLRGTRTFLTYQHSFFRNAPGLRARAGEEMFAPWRWLLTPLAKVPPLRYLLSRLFEVLEKAVPSSGAIEHVVNEHAPDLVFVTPLVHAPARQNDYLKSAVRMGIPSVVGVASWDNLTTKGSIQFVPDAVLVWNEAQRKEAMTIHRMPTDRIVVTGAQSYDHWFTQKPSVTREQFCHRAGLNPANRTLLYLCSSRFFQDSETDFIHKWLRAIRSSPHPLLKDANVVIRPYPTSGPEQWKSFDLSEFANVVVWPDRGQHPLEAQAKETYFDSLYHSDAVVGANTSGLIEAGIVGRRCYSILAPEFEKKQFGMPHFSYLSNSGFLVTAPTFEEHLTQLESELSGKERDWSGPRQFLSTFIRPHGLDKPAAPNVVQALEQVAQKQTSPCGMPIWLMPLTLVLAPVALATWGCAALSRRIKEWAKPKAKAKPSAASAKAQKPVKNAA